MIQYEDKTLLTTNEACSVLNRSMEALRQMIYRKKFTMKKIGHRIYLDNDEVMTHYARKMKLPSFESLNGKQVPSEAGDAPEQSSVQDEIYILPNTSKNC